MATKDITASGTAWPTFKSVKNLEEYDAKDDEAVAQAQANAAKWLQERQLKIQSAHEINLSQTITGDTDWHDTGLYRSAVALESGDLVRVTAQWLFSVTGSGVSQNVQWRIKWTDADGDSYGKVAYETAPNAATERRARQFTASKAVSNSGGTTLTARLQMRVDNASASIGISDYGQLWVDIQRPKADDIL